MCFIDNTDFVFYSIVFLCGGNQREERASVIYTSEEWSFKDILLNLKSNQIPKPKSPRKTKCLADTNTFLIPRHCIQGTYNQQCLLLI